MLGYARPTRVQAQLLVSLHVLRPNDRDSDARLPHACVYVYTAEYDGKSEFALTVPWYRVVEELYPTLGYTPAGHRRG